MKLETTRDYIEVARKALGISAEDCALVAPHRHAEITRQIAEQFTLLRPQDRPLHHYWWWEHFAEPSFSMHPPEVSPILTDLLDDTERYWFVAEADAEHKKESAFWLYEMSGKVIPAILGEAPHFEYYIVERKMQWLLCENHHGVLIAVGQSMVERLEEWTKESR